MNVPLIVAGSLAILGAAIHGVGGEVLVRKLSPGMLPSSPFGGPRTTKSMLHVTWHMTTIAFLTVGLALLLSGSVLHGDTARGIALVAASAICDRAFRPAAPADDPCRWCGQLVVEPNTPCAELSPLQWEKGRSKIANPKCLAALAERGLSVGMAGDA